MLCLIITISEHNLGFYQTFIFHLIKVKLAFRLFRHCGTTPHPLCFRHPKVDQPGNDPQRNYGRK